MIINSIFEYLNAADAFQFFVNHASYWFVFIFMIVESSFIPFPSEVIVPPAAYIAVTKGDMNILMIVLVATLGALIGALINYGLALWIGRPVIYSFANSRVGHMCMISPEKVQKAEAYFYKHGAISTFIGRLIPTIRQLISIPAGIARMNILQFTVFTFLGALVWNSVLGALGFWLAESVSPDHLFEKVEEYNRYLTWGGYILAGVCVIFILFNALKPKSNSQ